MLRKLAKWRDYAAARLTARRAASALLDRGGMRKVLVVCYGNIYRSPFAAACLAARSASGSALEVRSAGFHNREGRQVEPDFQEMIRSDYGIDLSAHRSRRLTSGDLEWADFVVIMDGHNYRMLHDGYRQHLAKSLWLGAVSAETPVIIRDPYGLSADTQRAIAGQLDVASRTLLARLDRIISTS